MKIPDPSRSTSPRRKDGMAVIVVLALLALVLAFIAANTHAIFGLGDELKVIENKQIRRLNHSTTNNTPAMTATNSIMTAQATKSLPE